MLQKMFLIAVLGFINFSLASTGGDMPHAPAPLTIRWLSTGNLVFELKTPNELADKTILELKGLIAEKILQQFGATLDPQNQKLQSGSVVLQDDKRVADYIGDLAKNNNNVLLLYRAANVNQ